MVDAAVVCFIRANHQHDIAQRGIRRQVPVLPGDLGRFDVGGSAGVDHATPTLQAAGRRTHHARHGGDGLENDDAVTFALGEGMARESSQQSHGGQSEAVGPILRNVIGKRFVSVRRVGAVG